MSFIQTMTGGSVRYLEPVKRTQAKGLLAQTYEAIEREFALVPPLTIQSACPEVLAGLWIAFREVFVVDPDHRTEREIVSAGISQVNECPYCVEVHSAMLDATGDHGLAMAIRSDGREADENAVLQWAKATLTPGDARLANPPFPLRLAPQMLGTALLFHYVNRMVSVFLDESPSPMRFTSRIGRNLFGRVFGGTLGRRLVTVRAEAGRSLGLLDRAPLPDAFNWARPDPIIASALARFNAAVETAGGQYLPIDVRCAVTEFLDDWHGETMPLSNHWMDNALSGIVVESDRIAARLALLTAVTPYRVERRLIEDFQAHFPGDAAIVAATAWASLAATKRIASWIAP
ncbi:MAG: carboxymuconolactone decarboxylase family protein [Alphaproteobacteria bacterium]|nr:carboxymuconolactone decarboxylase family protein [Alphaproteobacteria bacterium]